MQGLIRGGGKMHSGGREAGGGGRVDGRAGQTVSPQGKRKDKGRSSQAKSKASGKEKSGKERSAKARKEPVPPEPPPPPAAVAAERSWQPTRSVLQQGARETGMKVGDHVPGQGLK